MHVHICPRRTREVDAAYAAVGRMAAPAFEVTFMATAVGLVRAGLGVTLLPSTAHEVRAANDLAVRTIDDPGLQRSICVMRLKERSLSPAGRRFVEMNAHAVLFIAIAHLPQRVR